MKLAGLTWWRNNYGSILQAYALQYQLNEFEGIEYEILCQYGKKIISFDNLVDKIKKMGIRKAIIRAFWRYGISGLRGRTRALQNFVDLYLFISKQQYTTLSISLANDHYDGFICGSDQIWNPQLSDETQMYRLTFADDTKLLIAYAPSIGVDHLTAEQEVAMVKDLSRFKAISCREENGTKLINSIIGSNRCVTVLDPTMLVDRKLWDSICSPRKYNFQYVFVYLLRGTKVQRKEIERFAHKENLKIVTFPFLETDYTELYDLKFGDVKFWDATPNEFISVIRYAKFVITDSFHSTIFSCLYHVDFFIFRKIGKAQMNRIDNLQEIFEIENRMVNSVADIDRIISDHKIDWKKVDTLLKEKRKQSYEYLRNALQKDEVS